ncbi:MAG: hypothetical protein AB7O52_12735 [Planctomycetota bacterium]
MGTFHHDKSPLHGLTVVVDTLDTRVFVGRCDTETPDGIILLDADMHDEADGKSKNEYLRQASAFGIWKKFDRLMVPREDIHSVRKLGELK